MEIEIIYTKKQVEGRSVIGAAIGHCFVPRKKGETEAELKERAVHQCHGQHNHDTQEHEPKNNTLKGDGALSTSR
jgi:hypothetical protein